MPIVIDDPQIEARLSAFATARGIDPARAVQALLDQAQSQDEEIHYDLDAALEGCRKGLADIEAGRSLELEEFIARRRQERQARALPGNAPA